MWVFNFIHGVVFRKYKEIKAITLDTIRSSGKKEKRGNARTVMRKKFVADYGKGKFLKRLYICLVFKSWTTFRDKQGRKFDVRHPVGLSVLQNVAYRLSDTAFSSKNFITLISLHQHNLIRFTLSHFSACERETFLKCKISCASFGNEISISYTKFKF